MDGGVPGTAAGAASGGRRGVGGPEGCRAVEAGTGAEPGGTIVVRPGIARAGAGIKAAAGDGTVLSTAKSALFSTCRGYALHQPKSWCSQLHSRGREEATGMRAADHECAALSTTPLHDYLPDIHRH